MSENQPNYTIAPFQATVDNTKYTRDVVQTCFLITENRIYKSQPKASHHAIALEIADKLA